MKKIEEPGTVGDRVRSVIDAKYQGNHREASRQLGVSQPSVWRAVNSKQPPSIKLLLALADRANVDLNWLLTGKGNEYGRPAVGLPVAYCLLPGAPRDHTESLTGRSVNFSGHFSGDTAYVVESPVPGVDVDSAEYVVLDANPTRWRTNIRAIDGQVCAVVRKMVGANNIELRRITCVFDDAGNHAELRAYRNVSHGRAADNSPDQLSGKVDEDKTSNEHTPRLPRSIRLPDAIQPAAPGCAGTDRIYDVIDLDDVVAIAVLICRDLLACPKSPGERT